MSKDSDSSSLPLHYYGLYRLISVSTNPIISSNSNPSSFSSLSSDSTDGFDLDVIHTDIPDDIEKQLKLKKYLLNKTAKGSYESGSITLLPTFVLKNKVLPSATAYWTILKAKEVKFILCLINASESEGFNLFRFDMERYAKKLEAEHLLHFIDSSTSASSTDLQQQQQQLLQQTYLDSKSQLISYLQNWYKSSIEFVARATLIVSDELDVIIHCCLMGSRIEVKTTLPSSQDTMAEDIFRLLDALQLPVSAPEDRTSVFNITGSNSNSHSGNVPQSDDDGVIITIDPSGRASINVNESNDFCKEWAFKLVQGCSPNSGIDALQLRSWIELVKLRITQELNHIRKLTESAITDNYTLYQAFLYLKKNPNKDVLLVLLLKEISATKQAKEVLHVIYRCLTTRLWPKEEEQEEILLISESGSESGGSIGSINMSSSGGVKQLESSNRMENGLIL